MDEECQAIVKTCEFKLVESSSARMGFCFALVVRLLVVPASRPLLIDVLEHA